MPLEPSSRASLRWVVRQWLIPLPDGLQFNVKQACKMTGIPSTYDMGLTLPAYVGHLLTSLGGDSIAGEAYRLLPLEQRTPEHELPL